jgi:hypothetical protein
MPPRQLPGAIIAPAPAPQPPRPRHLLSNLGVRFSALGRPAEALLVAQEAMAMYRELAAASPGRHRPGLASSLDSLTTILAALGRVAEAEEARKEAAAT